MLDHLTEKDINAQNAFIQEMASLQVGAMKAVDDFKQTDVGAQMSDADINTLLFLASVESELDD